MRYVTFIISLHHYASTYWPHPISPWIPSPLSLCTCSRCIFHEKWVRNYQLRFHFLLLIWFERFHERKRNHCEQKPLKTYFLKTFELRSVYFQHFSSINPSITGAATASSPTITSQLQGRERSFPASSASLCLMSVHPIPYYNCFNIISSSGSLSQRPETILELLFYCFHWPSKIESTHMSCQSPLFSCHKLLSTLGYYPWRTLLSYSTQRNLGKKILS